jgi:hypothetical protein
VPDTQQIFNTHLFIDKYNIPEKHRKERNQMWGEGQR